MLTAALAVLCALLVLVLLVQRPAIWPVLVVLAVLWFALFGVFRYRVRSWVARWVCGGSFEKSKTQFSLEPLSQPAALLSGETVLWYNTEFRTRLMKGEALLVPRVQKVLPGLDLQEARKVSGQLLNLGFYELKKIGVVMKKAQYFITCNELPTRTVNELTPTGVRRLLVPKPKKKVDERQLILNFTDNE